MSTDREQRLEDINSVLTERDLKSINKLGDTNKGEIELTGIEEIYDHSKRSLTDVKFSCLFPNGAAGAFTIRFNANGIISDGAVMAVLINDKFAIVKQWRPALGRWTYELPRGFGEKLDKAGIAGQLGTLKIGDLPLGTLSRELGEEVMAKAVVSSVTHLGNIAENSSTHNVVPSHFMVSITVPEEELGNSIQGSDDEISKVLLWDTKKVRQEFGKKLCDSHSLTCLGLALNFIENLPKF